MMDVLNALNAFCSGMPKSYPNSSCNTSAYEDCESTDEETTPNQSLQGIPLQGFLQNVLQLGPAAKRFKSEDGEAVPMPPGPTFSRNPIFGAILLQDMKSVKLYLEDKPSFNIVYHRNMSPLHLAAQVGNIPIINELLLYGFDINAVDADDRTPLHVAVERGLNEVVRLLLNNRADANAYSRYGLVPLHIAVKNSNSKLLKPGDVLVNGATVTVEGAKGDNDKNFHIFREVIEELLSCGSTDVNIPCTLVKTALYYAVVGVDSSYAFRLVELLLSHNADPNIMNVHGKTALSRAMTLERVNITEALLKRGANVNVLLNQSDVNPIMWGISRRRKDIISQLLLYGTFNVNDPKLCANRTSLLHYAADVSNVSSVRVLIDAGADVTMLNEEGKTPFLRNPGNHSTLQANRKLLLEHMMRLESLNMYVMKPEEIDFIHSNGQFGLELHSMKLKYEMLGLKATQIPGTPFTFYDFFASSDHAAGLLVQNTFVQKYCSSSSLYKLFPAFSRIMCDRYSAGQVRHELIMQSKAFEHVERFFFGCRPQTRRAAEKIMQFLNNRDLKHLIMANAC